MKPNLQQLDPSLLLVFDALMRGRNLSRAAIRLHRSQPAVSNAPARLREQLDQPLFRHTAKDLEPAATTLTLYVPMRQALHLLQAGLGSQEAFDPHTARAFRLMMNDYAQLCLLPGLATRLEILVPWVTLEVRPDEGASVPAQLISGELDLTIDYLYFDEPELAYRLIDEERLVVVGRQGHPAFRGDLNRAAYEAVQHVSILPRIGCDSPLETVLGSARVQRRVQLLAPHYLTIPTIVASTRLLGIVPHRLVKRFTGSHGLRLVDVPFEMAPVQVDLIWHRQQEVTSGLQWLYEQIVQIEQG